MTTTYVGTFNVAALSLGVSLTLPELTARLGELTTIQAELTAKLADLQTKLAMMVNVTLPSVPALTVGLTSALSGVVQIVGQFPTASINISASISADISATLALIAAVDAKISLLTSLIADLTLSMAGAGIALYKFAGPANQMASEIGGLLDSGLPGGGGGTQVIDSIVVACSSPTEWAKFGTVMKVT